MSKHILGQAIFQSLILFTIVFTGHLYIPEATEAELGNDPPGIGKVREGEFVANGMMEDFQGNPLYKRYRDITPSRHMTIVFNLFVWLQIFNMLCARKINDEFNIFDGIETNALFALVLAAIVLL